MTYYSSKALFFHVIVIQFQTFGKPWYQLLYSYITRYMGNNGASNKPSSYLPRRRRRGLDGSVWKKGAL